MHLGRFVSGCEVEVDARVEARPSTLAQEDTSRAKLSSSIRWHQQQAPAIHASTMQDETGQCMLRCLLIGGKSWDPAARDQPQVPACLSTFCFSDKKHIYKSSLGLSE